MKKITSFLMVSMIIMVLAACGSEEKTVFEMKNDGYSSEITYVSKGDKVKKQITKTTMDYAYLSFSSKDEVKEFVEQQNNQLENLEGVKYSIDYKDDHFVENIEIDMEKIDFGALNDITGGEVGENADYISLKKSTELIEQQGFTKKE